MTGLKIFRIVPGCIFIFSIYAAITTKGKEGGIAASGFFIRLEEVVNICW